jgi:hypothetical protein
MEFIFDTNIIEIELDKNPLRDGRPSSHRYLTLRIASISSFLPRERKKKKKNWSRQKAKDRISFSRNSPVYMRETPGMRHVRFFSTSANLKGTKLTDELLVSEELTRDESYIL